MRDGLAAKFGKANVFMDVDNLLVGQRFDVELAKALDACDMLIAVIGPRWMDLLKDRTASGERDYVREEIAAALARKITVIPVRVGREGSMPALPRAADLPEDIRDLVLHQKLDVAHERFGRDMAELIEGIVAVRQSMSPPRRSVAGSVPWGWVGASMTTAFAIAYVGAYQLGVPVPWPWSSTVGRVEPARPDASRSAVDIGSPPSTRPTDNAAKAAADEDDRKREASAKKAAEEARARADAERQRLAKIEADAEARRRAEAARLAKLEAEADERRKTEQQRLAALAAEEAK